MLLDSCELPHLGRVNSRIVMSAMTRGFAAPGHLATNDMTAYYGRRAEDGVGLILTEGTIIDKTADGYNNVPHIETVAQAESWRPVVERVHVADGKIYSQLWHCGRISHSDYTGGVPPVSSTNWAAEGHNRQNDKPYGSPRALEVHEMATIYSMYRRAAKNALDVGFDGIQLHLGHGYLADQFFDSRVNDRDDAYGGSVENRCRFALEALEEVLSAVGPDRVMVRISPSRDMGGIYDWPNLEDMLAYLVPAFEALGLRILDISCARANYYETSGRIIRLVRPHWSGILMGGASLSRGQAEQELTDGLLDMVTWGRHLLANPDMVSRFKAGKELVAFEPSMLSSLE